VPPTTKHLSNNNPKKHEKNLKNHGKRTQKTFAVKLGFGQKVEGGNSRGRQFSIHLNFEVGEKALVA